MQDKRDVTEGFRISPEQKRIWRLGGGDSIYRVQCSIEFEGNINSHKVKKAVQTAIQQEEILHSSFTCFPGMDIPVQIIGEQGFIWQEFDIDGLDVQNQINDLSQELGKAVFDPQHGPLICFYFIMISPTKYMLLVNASALCADMFTLHKFAHRIGSLSTGTASGEKSTSADLQYADLSEWLNELIESEDGGAGKVFWYKRLSNLQATAQLYSEGSPGTAADFGSISVESIPSPSTTALRIDNLASQYGCSPEAFLLTCWLILLWRSIGEADIDISVASTSRKLEELQEAFGPLTRYLPLSFSIDEGFSFTDMLVKTEEQIQSANSWQEYFTWEQVATTDKLPRSKAFLSNAFEFNTFSAFTTDDFSIRIADCFSYIDRCDLKLACNQLDNRLVMQVYYNSAIYSPREVQRLAGRLRVLLAAVLDNPRSPIGKLEVLSQEEQYQILVEWNNTKANLNHDICLHQLFEAQAEKTPSITAVVLGNVRLTYAELNARANQLAHKLQRSGVGPEVLVAICMERSIEMIVGVLAVLKAGGGYVPLDPENPKARLAFMLEDAQAPLLLTQRRLIETFQGCEGYNGEVLCLDTEVDDSLLENQSNLSVAIQPDNLAYVIYTSGSTGTPKGVGITHRALCNRLLWGQQVYPLAESDKALQCAAFGFDFSVWEIFAPLSFGASVILVPPRKHQDSKYLCELIINEQVNFVHFVPSMLRLFIEERDAEQCTSLQHVFCGGEALLLDDQKRFFSRLNANLYNPYGPTEATIDITFWKCSPEEKDTIVPIGRPIANTQVYVLDQKQQIVPTGAPGELCIGGVELARGYLNRAELTAERFVPHPFSNEPGERLYRTGDLVRFRADGILEFIGRIDHQVKLRGFRIELGEIEVTLKQHSSVAQCAVMLREDAPGEKRLVAYVVSKQEEGASTSIADWRHFLQEQLPGYMVPAIFIPLDALPLTANGKLDRRALPAPDITRPDVAEAYVAPRTEVEEALVEIWCELLELKQIGVNDNFIELGGHSLLALQLISRICDVFLVELPLHVLFEKPTVAEQAQALIENEVKPGQVEKIASLLKRVRTMSEEDVKSALEKRL